MIEREEPERKQPKTITAEAYLDALWTYILGLARAGVEELQDKPSAAETDGSQTYDYVQIPLDVTVNSHARAKRFTASLPRALLPLQREELNRRFQPCRNMKMSAVPHPHYLVDTSVTRVITLMYLSKWQNNMLPTRLLQGHNLVSTIAGVLEELQEEKPLTTREELLGSNHRQSLIRSFGKPRWTARQFSVPELPGETSEGAGHSDAAEAGSRCDGPRCLVPTPAFSIKQASTIMAHRRRQEGHEQSRC